MENKKPSEPLEPERWTKMENEIKRLKRQASCRHQVQHRRHQLCAGRCLPDQRKQDIRGSHRLPPYPDRQRMAP